MTTLEQPPRLRHPLDPLSAEEVARATAILRDERGLPERVRFATVELREPPKAVVLGHRPGQAFEREVFVAVLDPADGKTYEALVSLTAGRVTDWRHVPDVHPAIMLEEMMECEAACKRDPRWQAAMRRRGIEDFDLVMVEPWSAGYYGLEHDDGRRIVRALMWVRAHPTDNGYAHPVENVIAVVELNRMEVLAVEDYGVVPVPTEPGNYTPDAVGPLRTDLKPIEIHQPEGVSFEVDGHEVRWQKWRFRIGFTPREGLVLHTVSYADGGRERPVLYRASVADMVVPYGDPRPGYFHRNAFDIGEYGIGLLANSLKLGCDCLGVIRYFDAVLADNRGNPLVIENAVCMHEEDVGILWKHLDGRLGTAEVRRSRRLVVSFIATVGNYEYGFYWYFYQDGSLQLEVKLTGILSNGALPPDGSVPPWGEIVAPGLYGPIHQHFFIVRLDTQIDGLENTVYEINTEADPPGPANPHGNAFRATATPLRRESEAQRLIDPFRARSWKIVNPNVKNAYGLPVGYRLVPGDNTLPFAQPDSTILQRAAFMTRHLWVTAYDPAERYATGDYPNQHRGGAGLPEYVAQDRPIENTDIVVWYTFGHHHVARPEDWPVMPVATIGFTLKPSGFFDRSPALDVPPPPAHCHATN